MTLTKSWNQAHNSYVQLWWRFCGYLMAHLRSTTPFALIFHHRLSASPQTKSRTFGTTRGWENDTMLTFSLTDCYFLLRFRTNGGIFYFPSSPDKLSAVGHVARRRVAEVASSLSGASGVHGKSTHRHLMKFSSPRFPVYFLSLAFTWWIMPSVRNN